MFDSYVYIYNTFINIYIYIYVYIICIYIFILFNDDTASKNEGSSLCACPLKSLMRCYAAAARERRVPPRRGVCPSTPARRCALTPSLALEARAHALLRCTAQMCAHHESGAEPRHFFHFFLLQVERLHAAPPRHVHIHIIHIHINTSVYKYTYLHIYIYIYKHIHI